MLTSDLLPLLVAGFAAGLSTIAAIGAQNAFMLRQGITGRHVPVLVLACVVSDFILIGAGVAGTGSLVERAPVAVEAVKWAGVAFLAVYGTLSIRRALSRKAATMQISGALPPTSLRHDLLTCLGFTWLNPHTYLDTLLLIGSLAAAQGDGRWTFGLGAMIASLVWFVAIGFGAHLLAPVFAKPMSWRVLDGTTGATMLAIGARLVLPG